MGKAMEKHNVFHGKTMEKSWLSWDAEMRVKLHVDHDIDSCSITKLQALLQYNRDVNARFDQQNRHLGSGHQKWWMRCIPRSQFNELG